MMQGSSSYRETREKKSPFMDQTPPCFELKEKFKCTEYIGKVEKWPKLLPKIRKTSPSFRSLARSLIL